MAAKAKTKLLKNYPQLTNPKLPHFIGCLEEHDKGEAKQAFKRVCFKDVFIATVESIKSNCKPVCIWRIHYQLKNKYVDYERNDNSNTNDIPSTELPKDEASLEELYENITALSHHLDMQVLGKFHTSDRFTAIVEYFPRACECEGPRMWPVITEVEIGLSNMKIHM